MAKIFEWMLPQQANEISKDNSVYSSNTVQDELRCLDIVIDAAERARTQTFTADSERRRTSFLELRRHAFGKTVVIKSSIQGEMTFRVSQANCEYASTEMGYSTPQSSVGQLCRLAYLGFEGKSKLWGNYEVIEVRNFSRFMGQQAEDNIRNFQLMQQHTYTGKSGFDENLFNIKNLRNSLAKWFKSDPKKLVPTPIVETLVDSIIDDTFVLDGFDIDYDDSDEEIDEVEQGDLIHSDYDQNDFIGISNQFYLNPTKTQMKVMTSHVSTGPMLVEGIAGSGKTCVAVGRAKTLCDSAGGGERLKGDNSKDFFAQESSVGFVRTGELVQYLKATCLELGLSHLPIQEYKELQHDLRSKRDIEQRPTSPFDHNGKAVFPKFKYLETINYDYQAETTMSWVSKVDNLIGEVLCERLVKLTNNRDLPNNIIWSPGFSQATAEQIRDELFKQIELQLKPLCNDLQSTSHTYRPFCIDAYVSKAHKVFSNLQKTWFNKDSLWINPTKDRWVKVRSNQEAITELNKLQVLWIRGRNKSMNSVLLRSIEDMLLVRTRVTNFIDENGYAIELSSTEVLWAKLKEGNCRCTLGMNNVEVEVVGDDDIIFYAASNQLLGMIDKRIFPAVFKNPMMRTVERVNKDGSSSKSSLAKILSTQIKTALFSRLKYADLYLSALKSDKNASSFRQSSAAIERLEARNLAKHDIDIMLAIAQILTRDAKNLSSISGHLLEQENYYRTVFIDEVQDFSEVQVFIMGRQAHPEYNSITMVGDLYQQLYLGSNSDPAVCFPYQGSIEKAMLIENKRQEHRPVLMALSSIFRTEIQGDDRLKPELGSYKEILRQAPSDSDVVSLYNLKFNESDEKVIELIKLQPKGRTIAVVSPTTKYAEKLENRLHSRLAAEDFRESYVAKQVDLSKKYLVHFSSPEHIKGLEFDTVIMVGLEFIDWDESSELNKVYVCISRPRKQLAVLADVSKLPSTFVQLFS